MQTKEEVTLQSPPCRCIEEGPRVRSDHGNEQKTTRQCTETVYGDHFVGESMFLGGRD